MSIQGASLADGQLPNAKGTLYTCPASTIAHVSHIILCNATAGAITVNLYVKRSGSTSRRIYTKDASLAGGAYVKLPGEDTAYRLSAGDVIEGDASAATSVDYFIDGGTETA